MELAENDIGAVAAERLRPRLRWWRPHFIGIPQHELARLDRPLLRVAARDAAAFDRRMADAISEPEMFSLARQCEAVLAKDHFNTRRLFDSLAGALHPCFEPS